MMRECCIAFLTTVFPIKEEYLNDFFVSLELQSYKHFDLIVVNDGFVNFSKYVTRYKQIKIIELNYSSTPAKNREYGINYCIESGYDILIFGDCDDYFDSTRIEVSFKKLNEYSVVLNDLIPFDDKSGKKNCKYFSKRLANNSIITLDDIIEKNFFGLSNTAVRISALKNIALAPIYEVFAYDWFLFSIILLSGIEAVFTNESVTYYRQHDDNIIGIGHLTKETLEKSVLVKLHHYKNMIEYRSGYERLYSETKILQNKIHDADYLQRILSVQNPYPAWWEAAKLI